MSEQQNSTESGDPIPATPSNHPKMVQPEKQSTIQVELQDPAPVDVEKEVDINSDAATPEDSGLERLKRHRKEVAGQVWIPEKWGKEELLKDWIDCSAFNASLVPSGIMSARAALIEEGPRANSGGLSIENRC